MEFLTSKINSIINRIVRHILRIEDYFCQYAGIRMSEIYLFAQSVMWAIWFLVFDVSKSSPVYKYIFSATLWAFVFGGLAILHLIFFIKQWETARARIITAYALVWFIWVFIAGYAAIGSSAAPTMANQCWLAVSVAIMVGRKKCSDGE